MWELKAAGQLVTLLPLPTNDGTFVNGFWLGVGLLSYAMIVPSCPIVLVCLRVVRCNLLGSILLVVSVVRNEIILRALRVLLANVSACTF